MEIKKAIELLAPAKNYEYGLAAINHGADAVYIAAESFGARAAAGNSMADIAKLINYAHRYYAKVYVVLNTILYEEEVAKAVDLAHQAYNSGCDALIIQDMGLLEAGLPPVPLFASTQTHNYNIDNIKFLESIGFQRVILARELSLKQLSAIRKKTIVDLECFVHGALCVSYSGQCYMSQTVTGRSANRGACAQLCRLPYDLTDEKGNLLAYKKHLLSLRDLNLSEYLAQLMEAGISSFKIEGRLKDIGYVKNITALYRTELDKILDQSVRFIKASSGRVKLNFEPDANRSFTRGFTTYFLNGRTKQMASLNSPKSLGQYMGKVTKNEPNTFTLETDAKLNNGDGICFYNKKGNLQGTRVNKVSGEKVFPLSMDGIILGTKIYRNQDYAFDKILNADSSIRQIGANLVFKSHTDYIILTAIDEDNITTELKVEQMGSIAKNKLRAVDTIKEQLSKTGKTLLRFNQIDVIFNDDIYFYPVSQINAWRRELIDKHEEKRAVCYKKAETYIEPNTFPYPIQNLDYTANISNSFAEKFYRRHGVKHITRALETSPDIKSPTVMFNRYCIKFELGLCPVKQSAKPTVELYLQSVKQKFKLAFDCSKCEMKIIKE